MQDTHVLGTGDMVRVSIFPLPVLRTVFPGIGALGRLQPFYPVA